MGPRTRISEIEIDRDYPFQIDMATPANGLAKKLELMTSFCSKVDFETQFKGSRTRWCFKHRAIAKWFQSEFGGDAVRKKN